MKFCIRPVLIPLFIVHLASIVQVFSGYLELKFILYDCVFVQFMCEIKLVIIVLYCAKVIWNSSTSVNILKLNYIFKSNKNQCVDHIVSFGFCLFSTDTVCITFCVHFSFSRIISIQQETQNCCTSFTFLTWFVGQCSVSRVLYCVLRYGWSFIFEQLHLYLISVISLHY